nr:hypothetical protein [Candidatus Prometheoarchaeum syntrophicum]
MNKNHKNKPMPPKFTWITLLIIGIIDIVRGLMHTFFMEQAIATFAHLDYSATNISDQLFQMNTLGISNIISGILFIIVALKAKKYADIALLYLVISHIIGFISIPINNIENTSDFLGKYIMLAYIGLCLLAFIVSKLYMITHKKNDDPNLVDYKESNQSHEYLPKLAPIILIILGCVDLVRAYAHTLNISYAAANIAGYDFTDPHIDDLLILMVAFGISNITTGLLHITIARKVPKNSEVILLLIPIMYFLGGINLRIMGIEPESQLLGQYMMIGYFAICIVAFIYTRIKIYNYRRKIK